MTGVQAFWEVPGFWPMVGVLLFVAAMASLAICFGPTEAPYEEGEDE